MSKFVVKLPGNPESKIVSKFGNPDYFRKIYLEMWSKMSKFSGIQVIETTKKVWNSDLLYGGRALFI